MIGEHVRVISFALYSKLYRNSLKLISTLEKALLPFCLVITRRAFIKYNS